MEYPFECSFCGKPRDDVAVLVLGPRVLICDECVATAVRIVAEEKTAARDSPLVGGPAPLPSDFWGEFYARAFGWSAVQPGSPEDQCGEATTLCFRTGDIENARRMVKASPVLADEPRFEVSDPRWFVFTDVAGHRVRVLAKQTSEDAQ